MFVTFILIIENNQYSFSCGPSFGPFWSVKYLNFEQSLPIWTAHHTFLEIEHPEVTKKPYYILFLEGSQKKVSVHGLHVIIKLYVIQVYVLCIICMWPLLFSVRVYISLHF